MRAPALLACLLVLASGASGVLAPAGARADEPDLLAAPEPGSYALPPLGAAGDGAVLLPDGTATRLHALYAGKVVLLAFVYSACGDADGCPLAHATFHRVGRLLGDDAAARARVRLLSLSFDPRRDTPETMGRLGGAQAPSALDWRFLTTASPDALRPILEAYGQAVTPERGAQGETGRLAHALRVFLIDPAGRIRNIYGASFLQPALVVADLKSLLAEVPVVSAPGAAGANAEADALLARLGAAPLGLPPLVLPDDNPATSEKIALGRKLFFDRRLSGNGTLSCANCHVPGQGFSSNAQRTAVGIEGRSVRRNAPTLYNAGHLRHLFHDGREARLEAQVWGPLLARNEMGNASAESVLDALRALPDYAGRFESAFPERGLTRESVGMAIASYERALVSGGSAFDRWRFGGVADALDASAARGFALFSGRAGCSGCHLVGERAALFSDDAFHNTGVGYIAEEEPPAAARVALAPGQDVWIAASVLAQVGEARESDLGRFEVTRDPADRFRYRTPSLRNVALTAPYMHDGSLATLAEVVAFYDRGGIDNPGLDPRIRPLALRPREARDLVAFLLALTGADVDLLVADAEAAPIGNPGDAAGGS